MANVNCGTCIEKIVGNDNSAEAILCEFKDKELCSLTWAMGSLDFYHPHFMRAMANRTQARIAAYNDQVGAGTNAPHPHGLTRQACFKSV
eukprot:scaffold593768_cov50-Prasinocladus_malaysianus.AAC.2